MMQNHQNIIKEKQIWYKLKTCVTVPAKVIRVTIWEFLLLIKKAQFDLQVHLHVKRNWVVKIYQQREKSPICRHQKMIQKLKVSILAFQKVTSRVRPIHRNKNKKRYKTYLWSVTMKYVMKNFKNKFKNMKSNSPTKLISYFLN